MKLENTSLSFVIILLVCLVSCDTKKNDHYLGKWQSNDLVTGHIYLDIIQDGELYKIHKYALDKKGVLMKGRHHPNKTYLAPLENGALIVNHLSKIAYSEKDGKLYHDKWTFTKID